MNKNIQLYYQCNYQNRNPIPCWNFCADAIIGAYQLGIRKIIPFKDYRSIPYNPYNILVGSVEQLSLYLNKEIKPIDDTWVAEYKQPQSIKSIEDINNFPVFIKPLSKIKAFTGFVAQNKIDLETNTNNYKGKLITKLPIDIQTEYRVYVEKVRGIIGIKHYLGDPFIPLEKTTVEKCVKESQNNLKELSYTLDFGVDINNKTFLIEVNDGWAIGNYGLDPVDYYNFIKKRWLQITGILK